MTALLHYFFLATFTWTLCEAVLVYNLLVKVFGANDRKWLYIYLALGWGMQHSYSVLRNWTILIYDCALQQSYALCLCYIQQLFQSLL